MLIRCLSIVLLSLAFAACESISESASAVREKFAEREAPQVRSYPAEPRRTYDAVRTAATQMGYRITRGGAAQGELEALSGVGSGERSGTARQLALKVKIERSLDGGSEVKLKITEILESDSSNRAGLATQTPLRDTPQYEVFFQRVGDILGVAAGSTAK